MLAKDIKLILKKFYRPPGLGKRFSLPINRIY